MVYDPNVQDDYEPSGWFVHSRTFDDRGVLVRVDQVRGIRRVVSVPSSSGFVHLRFPRTSAAKSTVTPAICVVNGCMKPMKS